MERAVRCYHRYYPYIVSMVLCTNHRLLYKLGLSYRYFTTFGELQLAVTSNSPVLYLFIKLYILISDQESEVMVVARPLRSDV